MCTICCLITILSADIHYFSYLVKTKWIKIYGFRASRYWHVIYFEKFIRNIHVYWFNNSFWIFSSLIILDEQISAWKGSCISVKIFISNSFFILFKISRPLSKPGPLHEFTDVLLALSKLDLKINLIPSLLHIFFN